ncbi:MAG: MFS transporter [Sarcina sp.]
MKFIEKLTILAIAFLSLIATAAIAPALGGIQADFSSASTTLVKLVITLPALICIPIGLLNSTFIKFISKKNLIIIGLILYLIGGISSVFSTNIYMLLFTRVVLGLGLGITAPLSLVLIGDFFSGKERAKFMGFSTASTNLGGILSTLVVGFLSGFSWKYAFFVYLITIVVLILVILFLPKELNKESEADIDVEKTTLHNIEKQVSLNKGIFKYAIMILLALVAFYAIPTNMDFLVKFKNIGGEQLAADIVSIGTLSSLISALLFGSLIKVFKAYYSIIIFVVMAIGCFLLGFGNSFSIILLGSILNGLGFGGIVPYTMLLGSNIVHKTHTVLSILIITSSLYLGEFLSPLILQWISGIIGISNATGSFFAASIVCIVSLIISIYSAIKDQKILA